MKKTISLLLVLILVLSLAPAGALAEEADLYSDQIPALDGALKDISITGTFQQSDARGILAPLNEFRTGSEAWYWNEDDTTKTVFNGEGDVQLKELVYDYALEEIAMQRAVEIAISFAHTRPNGESCFSCVSSSGFRTWGENIAMGTAGYLTADMAFTGWREDDDMYSGQGHRRNMLSSSFVSIGMAGFTYNGYTYWVQEFSYYQSGTPASAANDSQAVRTVQVISSDPVDPDSVPDGSVEISEENFPDDVFRDVVSYYCDTNEDGWLFPDEIAEATVMAFDDAGVASLQGIELLPELQAMACAGNALTEVDLSRNTKLEYLYCEGNNLKTLDISACPSLVAHVLAGKWGTEDGVAFYWSSFDGEEDEYWGLSYDEGVTLITGVEQASPDQRLTAARILQYAVGLTADKTGLPGETAASAAAVLRAAG